LTRRNNEASQLLDQHDVGSVLDPVESDCPTVNFTTEASSLVGDCAATATFSSSVNHAAGRPTEWTVNYNGTADLGAFDQPDLGALEVNWMSPQYPDNVDWDTLLAGFVVNARTHDYGRPRGSPGDVDVTATINESNIYQQPQQPLQQALEIETGQSYHVAVANSISPLTEGRYYVDGTGARAPFGGRAHDRGSIEVGEMQRPVESGNTTSLGLPVPSLSQNLCPQAAYNNLIRQIISESQHRHLNLDIATFPSHVQLQLYVHHYFDRFHPIFPFIRKASFSHIASKEWLLLLAVATIGSRYMRRVEGRVPGESLFTILDATLTHLKYGYGKERGDECSNIPFVPGQHERALAGPNLATLQAGVLNVIILQHSSRKVLVERAFIERHYLVEACHSLELVSRTPSIQDMASTTNHLEPDTLQNWLIRETEIRVGMMIWVLRLLPCFAAVC
jgi:hypothetical protein